MKKVKVQKSNIEGKGLFANELIKKGDVIGVAHHVLKTKNYEHTVPTAIVGRYHNHSEDNPNSKSVINGDKRFLVATKDIKPDEEITTNYYDTPHLEQPKEEWKARKGGSVNRPKTRKLNSKQYSRSLEATNELFAINELFQKPKSKKRKIFNPNAKYYNKGGTVDSAFDKKLGEVAKRLKVSKSDLIGIMKHESGLNPAAVNPHTGATGLIQFMPATAKSMGTSVEALRNMSAIEQLDYVEKFYKPVAGKAKDIGDLYMYTFLPAAVGKSDDFVIGAKGSGNSIWGINQDALYRQNAGFDKDKKGYYTVGDVKSRIAKFSGQKLSPEDNQSMTEEEYKKLIEKDGEMQIENPEALLKQQEEADLRQRYKNAFAGFELDTEPQPQQKPNIAAIMASLAPKRAINAKNQAIQLALDNAGIERYVKGGYIVEEVPVEFNKGGTVDKTFSGAGISISSKTKTGAKTAAEKALEEKLAKLTKANVKVPGSYKKDPVFQQVANQTKKNAIAHQESKKNVLNNLMIKPVSVFNYESPLDAFVKNNTPVLTKEQKAQMKAEEDKAVQDAILSKGMLNNTGKLDPEREEFIRNQVRAKYNNASSQYYKDKKEIDAKIAKVDPASVLTKKSKYKDYDVFQTQEQKAKEQIDKAAQNLINSGAAFNYYKKDNSGKDYKELIMDDLIKANNNNQDVSKVLENIQNKKDESDYELLKKSYDDNLPMFSLEQLVNPFSGSKSGLFLKDFISDPLNVTEELMWDQDYMPGRHTILRDPSHPLYNYYTKRTQMDQSPLSQALQYINPFSSAAEASVAINKGDYSDAAYQFGEGMLKTAGLLALPEVMSVGSSYVLPGAASIGLPGLTYTAALEGLGIGYGLTQLPETYDKIATAVNTGKKEDIRNAVNQTATNALDFLGAVDFFKGVTKVPEKVLLRVLSGGSDATGFGKNMTKYSKELEKLYNAAPLKNDIKLIETRKKWMQAMDEVKAKYAEQGYNLTPDEILQDPVKVQYLKDEFLKIKNEGLAYMKSEEGQQAIKNMLEEFPEFKEVKFATGTTPDNIDEVKEIIFQEVGKDRIYEQGLKNADKTVDWAQGEYDKAVETYKQQVQAYADNTPTDPLEIDNMHEHMRDLSDNVDYWRRNMDYQISQRRDYMKWWLNNDPKGVKDLTPSIDNIVFKDRVTYDWGFEDVPLKDHPKYIPEETLYDRIPITEKDYIAAYENTDYTPQQRLLENEKEVNAIQIEIENLNRDLAQYPQGSDEWNKTLQKIRNKFSDLASRGAGEQTINNPNVAYNTYIDNNVTIGNKFLPGTEGKQIAAHEVTHTNPQVKALVDKMKNEWGHINYSYIKPTGTVTKNGKDIPYVTPIDKVLAEIDLYEMGEAPAHFKVAKLNPRINPDKVIPLTADEISSSEMIGADWAGFGPNADDAKSYFLDGSGGNEKETFLAELKYQMMEQGYGTRGKFTEQDVNNFYMKYVRDALTDKSDRVRIRLLDIAKPTKNTRSRIAKALNMPSAFKEGGEVDYELGDEVDEVTMKKLVKLGYTFQKI